MALLAACICCMWTLVFVWQDDMNQTQCSSYLWSVCLPASFAIHLVNFKAYRLYTFLAATIQNPNNKRRRKTIGQGAVILRSVGMTMVTAVILAISTGIDPPKVPPPPPPPPHHPPQHTSPRTLSTHHITQSLNMPPTNQHPLTPPPQSTLVVVDPYRAKLNYYMCTSGRTTTGLFYFLVIGHVVMSIACIMPIRNGFEAFQDGT